MTDVRSAAELERLPWLTDDKAPDGGRDGKLLLGWGIAAAVLVAGSSFWLGMNSATMPGWDDLSGAAPPEATLKLPQAAPAQPIVEGPAMPQVEPVAQPAPVVMPKPHEAGPPRGSAASRAGKRRVIKTPIVPDSSLRDVVDKQAKPSKAAATSTTPKLWTSWESAGASGRMVRIGTYPTRLQAKRAWAKLVKLYPGMRRLRAVTTDIPSLRNGRTYYRLQFGTTSQAHSEVLCQRMRSIGQSCVVVDVAGARSRSGNDGQPIGL